MTLTIVCVHHFLPNHDHGCISNHPSQHCRSSHTCTFLCSSVLHFSGIYICYIAASFATTNSLMVHSGAGGNFVMTTYCCISMTYFPPICSESGNIGDVICADFRCRAVQCARRTFTGSFKGLHLNPYKFYLVILPLGISWTLVKYHIKPLRMT